MTREQILSILQLSLSSHPTNEELESAADSVVRASSTPASLPEDELREKLMEFAFPITCDGEDPSGWGVDIDDVIDMLAEREKGGAKASEAPMQHVAYFDEGEFHWMSGVKPRDCELYASPAKARGEQA